MGELTRSELIKSYSDCIDLAMQRGTVPDVDMSMINAPLEINEVSKELIKIVPATSTPKPKRKRVNLIVKTNALEWEKGLKIVKSCLFKSDETFALKDFSEIQDIISNTDLDDAARSAAKIMFTTSPPPFVNGEQDPESDKFGLKMEEYVDLITKIFPLAVAETGLASTTEHIAQTTKLAEALENFFKLVNKKWSPLGATKV